MIPSMMRTLSGDQATTGGSVVPAELPTTEQQLTSASDKLPLTSDPECYAMVLQFYDGLCEWEEGSSTPVLHITWAQHALYSLGRFDFKARAGLTLKNATAPTDFADDVDDSKSDVSAVSSSLSGGKLKPTADSLPRSDHKADGNPTKTVSPLDKPFPDKGDNPSDNPASEPGMSPVVENMEAKASELNLGEKNPATSEADVSPVAENVENKPSELAEGERSGSPVNETAEDKPVELNLSEQSPAPPVDITEAATSTKDVDSFQASLVLRSVKMMGMKDLLVAERLNSGAIKLQLTAQSQVHLRHSRTAAAADFTTSDSVQSSASRKRIRRE